MQNVLTWTGHIIGFIAVALFFYSYQRSKKEKILAIQTVATALSCIQYLLIGAYSGFALNIICIIRNFVYSYRDKKNLRDLWSPLILALIMAGVSFFSWEGLHSLMITAGLVINTISLGVFGAKNIKRSIIVSSSLILTYNIFAGSYSGILSESLSIISAIIGVVRHKIKEKELSKQEPAVTE